MDMCWEQNKCCITPMGTLFERTCNFFRRTQAGAAWLGGYFLCLLLQFHNKRTWATWVIQASNLPSTPNLLRSLLLFTNNSWVHNKQDSLFVFPSHGRWLNGNPTSFWTSIYLRWSLLTTCASYGYHRFEKQVEKLSRLVRKCWNWFGRNRCEPRTSLILCVEWFRSQVHAVCDAWFSSIVLLQWEADHISHALPHPFLFFASSLHLQKRLIPVVECSWRCWMWMGQAIRETNGCFPN